MKPLAIVNKDSIKNHNKPKTVTIYEKTADRNWVVLFHYSKVYACKPTFIQNGMVRMLSIEPALKYIGAEIKALVNETILWWWLTRHTCSP